MMLSVLDKARSGSKSKSPSATSNKPSPHTNLFQTHLERKDLQYQNPSFPHTPISGMTHFGSKAYPVVTPVQANTTLPSVASRPTTMDPDLLSVISKHSMRSKHSSKPSFPDVSHIQPVAAHQPQTQVPNVPVAVSTPPLVDNIMDSKIHASPQHTLKHPSPVISKHSPFVWENHLNNEYFSSFLVKYVIPHHLQQQVNQVFKLMDNVKSYDDLRYNFDCLGPDAIINLFTSKREFFMCMDAIICLSYLPSVIASTKADVLQPDMTLHTQHAAKLLQELMSCPDSQRMRSMLIDAVNRAILFDTTEVPASPSAINMTPEETLEYIQTLNEVALYDPGLEQDTQVQKSLKKKIIAKRTPVEPVPANVSFTTNDSDSDSDDSGSSYSGSTMSSGNKKHRIKIRPKFSDKIIWDGRRTTFRPLIELLEGHMHQINSSYMIDPAFLKEYAHVKNYLRSRSFKSKYHVCKAQAKYDRSYLFGILQTVTRAGGGRKETCPCSQT